MNELKVASCFEFEKVLSGKSNKLFYSKSEVDATIAELKAENRKLKHALWLARVEKAKTAKNMFDILWKFASREKVGVTGCAHKIKGAKTIKEPKFFFAKFQIVENKCIEKADKFK